MPRTDPRRSLETAARHLFRNLRRPEALRGNPLVSAYFEAAGLRRSDAPAEAASAIRVAIRVAVERLRQAAGDGAKRARAQRQYAIVLRHDLGEEPRDVVARALGLSLRQFFRERSEATVFVARSLLAMQAGALPGVASVSDVGAAGLIRAQKLAVLGGFDAALRALAEIASTASDPSRRIDAFCVRARTALDLGDYETATESIARAERTFRECSNELQGAARTRSDARIALANVSRLSLLGTDDAVGAQLDRVLANARMVSDGPVTIDDATYFDLLVNDAAQRAGRGDFEGAACDITQMQRLLERSSDIRPEQPIDFAIWRAQALGINSTTERELVVAGVQQAAALAVRHGFSGRLAIALLTLAALAPSAHVARRYAADALVAAQQYGSPRLTAVARLHLAGWQDENAVDSAVDGHLRAALRNWPAGSRAWAEGAITASRISLARGEVALALDLAGRAQSVAARLNNPRLRGIALREVALAQLAAGRPRVAGETIRSALEILERHGTRNALSLARAAASRIDNERRAVGRRVRVARAD